MAGFIEARMAVLDVLRRELVGPDPQGEPFDPATSTIDEESAWMPRRQAGTGEEILTRDSPDRRYGIAVLYCGRGRARQHEQLAAGEGPPEPAAEDGDADIAGSGFRSQAAQAQEQLGDEPTDDLDLSGANEFRPTTMAVTFLAELPSEATLRLALSAGRYQERDVPAGKQTRSWWFRSPCELRAEWKADDLRSSTGRHLPSVTGDNLDGLDVRAFAVSRPRGDGRSLITVGVLNATSGSTPNHFLFQVSFAVSLDGAPLILPYPQSEHTVRDPEEESMDLLYRAFPTFAVGHGCAAGWTADPQTARCVEVCGEPLPAVETRSITPDVSRADGTDVKVPMAPLAGLVAGNDGLSAVRELMEL